MTSASQSGYIVCARPQVNGPFADVTPFSVIEEENEEDISIDVTSPISAFEGTDEIYHINSAELSRTDADRIRTPEPTEEAVFSAVFSPAPAVPNQPARTPSPRVAAPNTVNTEERRPL
ncbi:unnamed protein product [Dibothriocephalus latus]|uniref:Uncharacterized protein n=1 Tax=Dibothriocephalus latus TaxID=60516 RepID=A0A3P7QQ10_DIBLA|nr:unnamed protein product [Dibothriocephalus latus]